MLSFLLTFLLLKSTLINSQSLTTTVLDSVLQEHAFAPFLRHRVVTGVVYDANVGPELTGIRVSALRLRSGALRRKGYLGFKEFDIPAGVVVSPYVGRVVLVYQNMGNWSSVYYGLKGYVFLSPVVGLLAYNASFLSPEKSPETLLELDVLAVEEPMVVKFGGLKVLRNGLVPKCVYFDLFGGVEFDHVVNGSVCLSVKQGHFGVVVEDGVPVAAPENVPENPIAIGDGGGGGGGGGGDSWWVGGVVVGCGVVVVVIVAVLLVVVSRCRRRRMIEKMECAAEGGVPLAVVAVGGALVPVATETRTKPILENEYVS